jgi:hypothetical protein
MHSAERLSGYMDALAQKLESLQRAVGMPAFESAWAFIEQLSRIFGAPDKNGTRCWCSFVTRYFPQPTYAPLVNAYGPARSRTLHNYSSAEFAYSEEAPDRHMSPLEDGKTLLNLNRLVTDLAAAFVQLREDLVTDPDLARRALAYLDVNRPITGMTILIPDPRAAASDGGTHIAASFAASASWTPATSWSLETDPLVGDS